MVKDDILKVQVVRNKRQELAEWITYCTLSGLALSIAFPEEAREASDMVTSFLRKVQERVAVILTLKEIQDMPETEFDDR